MPLAQSLRRCMAPLRHTPLHPQWLTCRDESRVRRWIGEMAGGHALEARKAPSSVNTHHLPGYTSP